MTSCYELPQWMRPRRCSHVQGEPPEDGEADQRTWCGREASYRSVAKADAALIGVGDTVAYWCAAHAPPVTVIPKKLVQPAKG